VDTGITQTGTTPGTPDYMAPECVLDLGLDGRADQYALATILYQTLAGRLPIMATSPIAALFKKAKEDPRPLREVAPEVPEDVSTVVMRGLARDREERYPSCGAFVIAFSRTREWGGLPLDLADMKDGVEERDAPTGPDSPIPEDVPRTVVASEPSLPDAPLDSSSPPEAKPAPLGETRSLAGEEPRPRRGRPRRPLALGVLVLLLLAAVGLGGWWLSRDGEPEPGPAPERTAHVVLLEPEDGAVVGERVKVAGTIEGEGPFEVLVNDAPVSVTGNRFEGTVPAAGTLEILARGEGCRGEATVSLVLDPVPPVLRLDGAAVRITREESVRVSGAIEDDHPGHVLLDGVPHEISEGRFELSLPSAVEAGREFLLQAVDAAGNVSEEATVRVVRDPTAPVIRWTTRPPALTREERVVIAGTVEDAHPSGQVLVDDEPHPLREGRFEKTIDLPRDGPRVVRVRAVDVAGNESTEETVRVVRDRTAPEIVLDGTPPALTRETEVVVAGRVVDANPAEHVLVDGEPRELRDGRFEITVALPEDGPREVRLQAVDAAGNESGEETVTVVRDRTPPVIELDDAAVFATMAESFLVGGWIRDAHLPALVLVQGTRIGLDPEGRFSCRVALKPGDNPIPIEVTDRAGNVGRYEFALYRGRVLRVPRDIPTIEAAAAKHRIGDRMVIESGPHEATRAREFLATLASGALVRLGRWNLGGEHEAALWVQNPERGRRVIVRVREGQATLTLESPQFAVRLVEGQFASVGVLDGGVYCTHFPESAGEVEAVMSFVWGLRVRLRIPQETSALLTFVKPGLKVSSPAESKGVIELESLAGEDPLTTGRVSPGTYAIISLESPDDD
jgi:hypothetical protein